MPLLRLETTVALNAEKENILLTSLSKVVAEIIGKPEQYVMVSITPAKMLMSAQSGETALVEVRSIGGLNGRVNGQLAQKICALIHHSMGIPPERIYLNFVDVAAGNWAWNGETFG